MSAGAASSFFRPEATDPSAPGGRDPRVVVRLLDGVQAGRQLGPELLMHQRDQLGDGGAPLGAHLADQPRGQPALLARRARQGLAQHRQAGGRGAERVDGLFERRAGGPRLALEHPQQGRDGGVEALLVEPQGIDGVAPHEFRLVFQADPDVARQGLARAPDDDADAAQRQAPDRIVRILQGAEQAFLDVLKPRFDGGTQGRSFPLLADVLQVRHQGIEGGDPHHRRLILQRRDQRVEDGRELARRVGDAHQAPHRLVAGACLGGGQCPEGHPEGRVPDVGEDQPAEGQRDEQARQDREHGPGRRRRFGRGRSRFRCRGDRIARRGGDFDDRIAVRDIAGSGRHGFWQGQGISSTPGDGISARDPPSIGRTAGATLTGPNRFGASHHPKDSGGGSIRFSRVYPEPDIVAMTSDDEICRPADTRRVALPRHSPPSLDPHRDSATDD